MTDDASKSPSDQAAQQLQDAWEALEELHLQLEGTLYDNRADAGGKLSWLLDQAQDAAEAYGEALERIKAARRKQG